MESYIHEWVVQLGDADQVVAYRGHHRWVQTFEPIRLEKLGELTPRLRKGGVYLIGR